MKKLFRKLTLSIVATLMLVVTMTTSTFAWIAMITEVEAKGMKFKVETPNSLWISETGEDGDFKDAYDFEVQDDSVKLYPVSSVSGETFFAPSAESLKKINDRDNIYLFQRKRPIFR